MQPINTISPIKPLILGLVLLLTACGGQQQQTATTDTVVDDYGRTVVVPANPQRVVSLSPAVTEIIFALGAQDLLVGRTDFCEYPAEAQQIPSIGGISNLNIEKILSLNPDLVISGSMVGKKVTDQMDVMGTPMVCVIEKPHFDALYDNITAIGRLVGKEHEADSLNALLRKCANALENTSTITQSNNNAITPKVYYVVGFGPSGNFTAGGNTFINDIISMAGGRNIAEDIDGWSYSLEALVNEDPDYIIVRREDSAAFCGMKPYNRLSAVRNGHVIGIVSGTLDLQVPRNIDAILYLRQRMGQYN
ncbi:MAG: ABC transporter substrate-binding protein [Bacteroidales bacterium]|nr:ABC transporter substrate-binding protein [Bacteroidales bacterium]